MEERREVGKPEVGLPGFGSLVDLGMMPPPVSGQVVWDTRWHASPRASPCNLSVPPGCVGCRTVETRTWRLPKVFTEEHFGWVAEWTKAAVLKTAEG